MTKKHGFTIVELLISISMLVFLLLSIGLMFRSSTQAVLDAQARTKDRTKLAQAIELMSRQLRLAQSITVCNATTLTFNANLGSGLTQYTYSVSGTNLLGTSGAVIAADVQSGTAFSCSGNQVTISLTTNSSSTTNNTGEKVAMTTIVSPVNPVVYGLMSWWKMGDGTIGNACSGASVADSSGNGWTGTCNNSPTWVTGNNGNALSFNGTNQSVSTNYSGILGTNPISVTAWVKTNTTSISGCFRTDILTWGTSGNYFRLGTIDYCGCYGPCEGTSGLILDFDYVGESYNAYSLFDNNWHFVAITIPASATMSQVLFYEDGHLLTTSNFYFGGSISILSGSKVIIGASTQSGELDYFKGSIGNVRIYNRALSSAEIQQLYNARL